MVNIDVTSRLNNICGLNLVPATGIFQLRQELEVNDSKILDYWRDLLEELTLVNTLCMRELYYFTEMHPDGSRYVYIVLYGKRVFWLGQTVSVDTYQQATFDSLSAQYLIPVDGPSDILHGIKEILRQVDNDVRWLELLELTGQAKLLCLLFIQQARGDSTLTCRH